MPRLDEINKNITDNKKTDPANLIGYKRNRLKRGCFYIQYFLVNGLLLLLLSSPSDRYKTLIILLGLEFYT